MKKLVQISPEDVLVRAQETPNPNAIKFITNFSLKEKGNATFTSIDQCKELPMARSFLDIPGVVQIYFFQNTVTVTHNDELPADMIKEHVKSILKTRLTVHDPDFVSPEESKATTKPDRSNLSPELQKIEEILDRTIRPGLQSDGGDVEILGYEDNTLRIIYQGACGGCPSSMMGTLEAIQGILRNEIPNELLVVQPI
jgi:Fe-S cluster biogenesis protein NfuA